ncbi:MAG TPA: dihydrolipoyl dehydrogenase [Alphaproteobacteria bacterium]|nr:dihydrolipoyl dehydrogenase [Alphaproteobacteria bacterium]
MVAANGTYDLVVIGAGPGGYVAAIRAAQLGLKVACVDKRGALGGTCLNVGCIPSKALLQSSEKFAEIGHGFARHGISAGPPRLDLAAMMANKDKVVSELTNGVAYLFRKNKVTAITGTARIANAGEVEVKANSSKPQKIAAKNILIATGSEPTPLPGLTVDEQRIVTSTGALALKDVPKKLAVVGGGYIGLELGSVWRRLGADVTVIEFLDRIVPAMDREIGQALHRVLEKQGIEFRLSTRVVGAEARKSGVSLQVSPASGGKAETLAADVVLVAIGRRPHTEGLGLSEVGVAIDNVGRVKTDAHFQTSVPGIYAIGDCIAGPQLAHKASDEGVAVAEIIAGQAGHVNYDAIPAVVYTAPEVATVGRTEEELKEAGVLYKAGKFPFTANPRARIMAATEGMVKILCDAKTDRILGVHIIGAEAGTMIHEAVVAMEFGASAEDLARICHAHPTLSEAVHEAALAVAARAIHI